MEQATHQIQQLFSSFNKNKIQRIRQLPQSGSERLYYRIYTEEKTFIATFNQNIKENKTFIYFSQFFKQKNIPVPEIYTVNNDCTIYIQQDLGTENLLNKLETNGHNDYVFNLFKKSLSVLAKMQISGDKKLDYNYSLTAKEFGKQAIMSDLLYFKYYFLDTLRIPYDKQIMLDDFEALSSYLTKTEHKHFMFRDFQSRNIIVNNDEVFFIDYQGGMKGALQYDVASLLWQAKAELSVEWKNNLLNFYMDEVDKLFPQPIDRNTFVNQYNGYVLIRLLQVLGAYGFRGLFERKAHFLASIPLALKNIKYFLANSHTGIAVPEFERLLKLMTSDEIIERYTPPQATKNTPLKIHIYSFSYRNGIPPDETNNGGGFVFDMRGILNPGRMDEYKTLTGKDKAIMDFLEQHTRINKFLNSVWDLIDITVEDYLKRGFDSLMINFGCTGGQHRSVYAAEQTARHLRNKYKLNVEINHTNEKNWVLE